MKTIRPFAFNNVRPIETRLSLLFIMVITVAGIMAVPLESNAEPAPTGKDGIVRKSSPEFLTFDDLVALSKVSNPSGRLDKKLSDLLHTPFISNEAYYASIHPHRPQVNGIGPVLRACEWNIERGIEYEWIERMFSRPDEFMTGASHPESDETEDLEEVRAQLDRISQADLFILNEVDLGMPRTDYRNIVSDLARVLGMNYAFGVEFVEVDPLKLGLAKVELPDREGQKEFDDQHTPDRNRYRGLQGTAVLSRYPIRNVEIKRLHPCYDWYGTEKAKVSELEEGKREAIETIFLERILREVRHGNRMAMRVDLTVPEMPTGLVTVVGTHLENKCAPECRRKQMEEILDWIRNIPNPVIMGGDLNTTGTDSAPTSVKREVEKRVKNKTFWAKQVLNYLNPIGIVKLVEFPAKYYKTYQDPTSDNIPIIAPNEEAKLFDLVEEYRFSDGFVFDFRGEEERTLNQTGSTLANSNQRTDKGFKPTFEFERDLKGTMGELKLDWFLIKAFTRDTRDESGDYFFAPHFPCTMEDLAEAPPGRLADHFPITVDLPLTKPPDVIGKAESSKTE